MALAATAATLAGAWLGYQFFIQDLSGLDVA